MTPRQLQTLKVIGTSIQENGYSPSMREIAQGLGSKSLGRTNELTAALLEDGWITRTPNRARSIQLTAAGRRKLKEVDRGGQCPTCGQAIERKAA